MSDIIDRIKQEELLIASPINENVDWETALQRAKTIRRTAARRIREWIPGFDLDAENEGN